MIERHMEFNFIETSESQSSYVDENGDMPPHKPEIYHNDTLVYHGGTFMVTPFSLLVSVSFVTCFCIKLYTIYKRTIQGERQPIPRVYRYTQRIIQKTLTSDDLEDPLFPECSICLEEYRSDDRVAVLPCNHVFHLNCVRDWVGMHNNCPLCRREL